MSEFLRLAFEGSVVRRALRTALIVGSVLTAINHGEALLHGDVDAARVFRICLTVLVPYTVSTTSSVLALRGVRRSQREDAQSAEQSATSRRSA
jgi:hypothetical protein